MKSSALWCSLALLALPAMYTFRRPLPAPAAPRASLPPAPRPADCGAATGLARVVCLAEAFKATLSQPK